MFFIICTVCLGTTERAIPTPVPWYSGPTGLRSTQMYSGGHCFLSYWSPKPWPPSGQIQWLFCKIIIFLLSTLQDLIPGTISYFWNISLPLLSMILFFCISVLLVGSFLFPHPFYLLRSLGLPLLSPIYLWRVLFDEGLLLYACAFSRSFILGLDIAPAHRCVFLFTRAFSMNVSHQCLKSNCRPVPRLSSPVLFILSYWQHHPPVHPSAHPLSLIFCCILPAQSYFLSEMCVTPGPSAQPLVQVLR